MRRRIIIFLSIIVALVVFAACSAFIASKPLPLRVGSTVKDPWAYVSAAVEDDHSSNGSNGFRRTYCGTMLNGVIVYGTQFSFPHGHLIASRTFAYSFDTNGTVITIKSKWKFPILDF